MSEVANLIGVKSAPLPRARIGGAPRAPNGGEGQVLVRNVETGEEARLNRANARDLVDNVGGWKIVSHGGERPLNTTQAPVAETEPTGNAAGETEPVKEPNAVTDEALAELTKFREQAAELGIAVDQRWGKRRLAEEIAKKTGAA